MKRIVSLILVLVLMSSLPLLSANADVSDTTEQTPAAMYGDLDGDENITSSDALFILRMGVQLEKITDENKTQADVDKDGEITSADALLVLRYSVKLSSNDIVGTMVTDTDDTQSDSIEYWAESSPAMASIISFVNSVTDESSENYLPPERRIAVFDSDGTLYGELFPTYFDQCVMIYRLVHDDSYEGNPEDAAYCRELEKALINKAEKPKAPRSSGEIIAEAFKGFTVEEYREYIRKFMSEPVKGFENMTYADGYYKPMISLVKYLSENGFKVYINSGSEVNMLRELSGDTLSQWIPSYQILGTTYGLTAEGQGDTKARDYTPAPDERITFDGTVTFKNLKLNKVVSMIYDLGISPVLSFGNSSGDTAMAQYVIQHGGKAYMLLCDDTERDHGNIEEAASFKAKCEKQGIETVSMKNEFTTIYGDDVTLTDYAA